MKKKMIVDVKIEIGYFTNKEKALATSKRPFDVRVDANEGK